MMNKIDLNKIKVVIFDFDNTLATHKDFDFAKHRNKDKVTRLNYYLNAYLYPDTFYETIEPCTRNEALYKLVNILKDKNANLYCVSGMRFSFHLKAKENFINKHYGNYIKLFSCKSQDEKCDAVRIIRAINNCNLDEMLFIDEQKRNLKRFRKMGINAMSPIDVENLLDKKV